jgi:hypothetical protein
VIQGYQARIVVIPGLLDTFDDPNIKKKEARKVISRIMKSINETSGILLVVTSVQDSKYASLIFPNFRKRIILTSAKYNILNAELYNEGRKASVMLSEKELRLVNRRN